MVNELTHTWKDGQRIIKPIANLDIVNNDKLNLNNFILKAQ